MHPQSLMPMRWALLLAAVAIAGCFLKAHQAAESGQAGSAAAQTPPQAVRPTGQPAVAPAPESILSPAAIRKLQRALTARGLPVPQTGVLDETTVAALQRFQRQHQLAATGMPDLNSLQLLGLDPYAIYRSPAAGEQEVPAAPPPGMSPPGPEGGSPSGH